MSVKDIGFRTKAVTLVTLGMLSLSWVLLLDHGSAADSTATKQTVTGLPEGTMTRAAAVRLPGSEPLRGRIALAVPAGSEDAVVNGSHTRDIPPAAFAAYERSAQIVNAAKPGCRMPWQVLAAIGRMESDHGRHGGNTLTDAGVSTPGVVGPKVALRDSGLEGGRALGPMQLSPALWSAIALDADGDGRTDPQDIDDATLTTAIFLCAEDDDLSSVDGQRAAFARFKDDPRYTALATRLVDQYAAEEYTVTPAAVTAAAPVVKQAATHSKSGKKKPARAKNKKKSAPAKPHANDVPSDLMDAVLAFFTGSTQSARPAAGVTKTAKSTKKHAAKKKAAKKKAAAKAKKCRNSKAKKCRRQSTGWHHHSGWGSFFAGWGGSHGSK